MPPKYINNEKQFDCREIIGKLHLREVQDFLKDKYNRWIDQSERELTTSDMYPIWEKNDLYYDAKQVPVGSSSDYLSEFMYTNSGRINTSDFTKVQSLANIKFFDTKAGRKIQIKKPAK